MMDVIIFAVVATGIAATAYAVEDCRSCLDLFSKLERGPDGRLSQAVEIQQRGEPKSGTSIMGSWAESALRGTCVFLGATYGSETCKITQAGDGCDPAAVQPERVPCGQQLPL